MTNIMNKFLTETRQGGKKNKSYEVAKITACDHAEQYADGTLHCVFFICPSPIWILVFLKLLPFFAKLKESFKDSCIF